MEILILTGVFGFLLVVLIGLWINIAKNERKLQKLRTRLSQEVKEKELALSAADNTSAELLRVRKERDEAQSELEYNARVKEEFKIELKNLREKNKKWAGRWVNVKKEINQARKALEKYRIDEAKDILNKARKRGQPR